ncbi:MAG: class III signal peptide-containing protein [Methanobrevibacter sp.]|nr:class III signal peptide-containing protein [Methanobrevibacter sp.]
MIFEKYEKKNEILNLRKTVKNNLKAISKDNSGQGAAEYILLFGGVIVIALAGLLIYRSYFSNNASGLNATQDISSIRNNVTSIY